MKHVSILIPEGHTSLVNIAGTHQILNQMNAVGPEPVFDVELVGLSKEAKQDTGLFAIIKMELSWPVFASEPTCCT